MLKIRRFINQLMYSNCYVVYDEDSKKALVIDPASEKSTREIAFIDKHRLELDYIIITHEHTDHNWGVNALREHYSNSKLVCSEECNGRLKKANRAYFLFYFDDLNYRYDIASADAIIGSKEDIIQWNGVDIRFVLTPGHSYGSMCIDIGGLLFTGDTIIPYKPHFNGRDSNEEDWKKSIEMICQKYTSDTKLYPGHGKSLTLEDWIKYSSH